MSQKRYDQLLVSHQGLMNGTLRDVILPSILGKEADDMLYWIGKDLAREYPVATHDDLIILTHQLGLGDLQLQRHDKTSQVWRLGGPIVTERIRRDEEQTSFGLELGFLAQEIEFQLGTVAEAELSDRHHEYVDITVQNDPKTDADSERSELVTFIHVTAPQEDDESAPKKKRKHSLLKKKREE